MGSKELDMTEYIHIHTNYVPVLVWEYKCEHKLGSSLPI